MIRSLRYAGVSVLLFTLALSGCASAVAAAPADPGRRLLASFMITESAHRGVFQRKTGYEFYVVSAPQGVAGPFLEGAKFEDGRVVDTFDWGTASTEIAAIENVRLVPFDFNREVDEVSRKLRKEAARRGELYIQGSRDGAEWEIVIVTASGRFSLRAWNPTSEIEALAPHSENLARLKAVIDLLALYYGRLKMEL